MVGYRSAEPDIPDKIPVDITERLNMKYLTYLNISHCNIGGYLYGKLPAVCPSLAILIMSSSHAVSHQDFWCSGFKNHGSLKLLNIAYCLDTDEIENMETILEVLQYNKGTVRLDITGIVIEDYFYDIIPYTRLVELEDYQECMF